MPGAAPRLEGGWCRLGVGPEWAEVPREHPSWGPALQPWPARSVGGPDTLPLGPVGQRLVSGPTRGAAAPQCPDTISRTILGRAGESGPGCVAPVP